MGVIELKDAYMYVYHKLGHLTGQSVMKQIAREQGKTVKEVKDTIEKKIIRQNLMKGW